MNKKKINFLTIGSLLTVSIPGVDNAAKRQVLSLISLVISSMCMFTPFLQVVSAGVGESITGPISYTINKTATGVNGQDGGNVTKAGDVISYRINVTNDGSVNLTNVTVTDSLINNLTEPVESNSNDSILDAGETWTYTGNYTVAQTDLNNNGTARDGFITNIATVVNDRMDPKNATVQTPIEQNANCTVYKIVTDVAGDGPGGNVTAEGDIVSYQISLTNNGNVDLTNVTVTDPLIDNLAGPIEPNSNDTVLNVGESWIYIGNHTVTRADITNNEGNGLVNNATVDSDQLGPNSDTAQVPIDPRCSIEEIITDINGKTVGNVTAAGDVIGYRVNVTNKGILNLTNVIVTASLNGNLTEPIGDDANPGVLNQGEIWTYYGSYTVTQSDMNNDGTLGDELINNTASLNCDQLGQKNYTVQIPIERKVGYSIFMSAIGPDDSGDRIINSSGDEIPYRIFVKNEGNVDLTGVSVNDPMISLTGPTGDNNYPGVLNPGETWTYYRNYTLTSADINSGNDYINNTATVSCNELSSESSSVEVPIIRVVNTGTDSETNNTSKVCPVADFSTSITSGYAPLTVQFTDKSTGSPTSWSWDFNNDGVADSSTQNPGYAYTTPGTYVAKLTVSNANGTSPKPATVNINVLQAASSSSGRSGEGSGGGSIGHATVVSSSNGVNSSNVNTSATANVTQSENETPGLEQGNGNKAPNAEQTSTPANVQTSEPKTTSTPAKESKKTPGFEIISCIVGLFTVLRYGRRQS